MLKKKKVSRVKLRNMVSLLASRVTKRIGFLKETDVLCELHDRKSNIFLYLDLE